MDALSISCDTNTQDIAKCARTFRNEILGGRIHAYLNSLDVVLVFSTLVYKFTPLTSVKEVSC